MMERCNAAGCGPSSPDSRNLEIWKQQGQPIGPVYASWGRPLSTKGKGASSSFDQKKGALHAKMFVLGPKRVGSASECSRIAAIGSTNWTVASETNQEVSTVLEIGGGGAAGTDHSVRDMRQGASLVSFQDMQDYARKSVQVLEDHETRYLHVVNPSQAPLQRNTGNRRRPPDWSLY